MESIATNTSTFFNNNANNYFFDISNESHTAADSQFDSSYDNVSTSNFLWVCPHVRLLSSFSAWKLIWSLLWRDAHALAPMIN